MFRFVPYILKSLWGHRARTMLTVSGAAVAMFVFCFVGSVQQGLDRLISDEDAQRSLIVFQENRFCPTSSRLPEDYATKIAKIPGVKDVMPVQVWTNNCRASLDIIVFNGAPPQQLKQSRNLTLTSGDWASFESQTDGAIVGQKVAQRRALKVGDQFSIGDMNVRIAGVFASPVPAEENLIYTSLKFLQYTRELEAAGTVTQHEVHLDSSADPDEVAARIDETLKAGPVATTTRRKGAFQVSTLSDLVDLISFAHWLGYASVGMVLALVGTTTLMSVQDRIKEYAVLQTLGIRPARVFRLILGETMLICIAGGLVGTGLALAILAWSGLAIGAEGVTIAFQASWQLALTALAVTSAVGITAGIIPAYQAATTPIVMALHEQ